MAVAGRGPLQHSAEIDTSGPRTYDPLELTQVAVGRLQGNGLSLTAVPESAATAPRQLQAAGPATSTGPSGKTRLHLQSDAEVEKARQLVREKALQGGPDLITLIAHQTGSGFPPRRPNRRAGTPGTAAAGSA